MHLSAAVWLTTFCTWCMPFASALPVVGFENLGYSVSEGDTLAACVVILSGGSNVPFSLQMVSVSGTATGKYS